MPSWEVIWGIAIVVFLVIEGLTVGLASIWFALGSLAALIAAFCGGPVWLQILLFLLVSIAALWVTRPLALKYINGKKMATNADRVVGTTCLVTETIDNLAAKGAVRVNGKTWTARSQTGAVIQPGTLVQILAIEGVKLIVCEVPAPQPEM